MWKSNYYNATNCVQPHNQLEFPLKITYNKLTSKGVYNCEYFDYTTKFDINEHLISNNVP